MPDALLSTLTHFVTALLAALTGRYFAARHYTRRKTHEFAERRLADLYGPLCSRLMKLKADGALKVAIFQAKNEAWKDKCERAPAPFLDHEKAHEPYKRSIEYENRHFRESVMPLYDEMLKILDDKRHLAFPSTLRFYDTFYRFVQLWHRWLDDAIPGEAIERIDVREEELELFYADIEARHASLVRKLPGDRKP